MALNGGGDYRLHQVEIEWTPEWEAAFQGLQELAEKRRKEADRVSAQIERNTTLVIAIGGLILILVHWLDWHLLFGLIAAGIVLALVNFWVQSQNANSHENPTPFELHWVLAELALLRSLTQSPIRNPFADEMEDDDPTSGVRYRLEQAGFPVESERYGWLDKAEQSALDRFRSRRENGQVELSQFQSLEGSSSE